VKQAFFSIIIPSYNRADLIVDSIKSVQNQTFENWECTIVDDGSTDNTKVVIEDIIKQDSRIKYVYQENAERSAARNNGIRNSSGEYICFLDSDDHFLSNHLLELKNVIETIENKTCMILNEMQIVEGSRVEVSNLPELSKNRIEYLYVNPLTPSRVCIHKKIVELEQFDEDIVIVEDRILWMRIANKFPVYISNHIGVKYNIHADNSVNLKGNGALKTYQGVQLGIKRYPFIFNCISKKAKDDMNVRVQTNIAYHYLLNGSKAKAIFWLVRALLTAPFHNQTKMRVYQICLILIGKNLKLAY
jgi:glycosyltransferase involved in cell wall biosynthesis